MRASMSPAMNTNDVQCLRETARAYRDVAQSPEMRARITMWKNVVSGVAPERCPVLCRVNRSAGELFREDDYQCTDPFLRRVEKQLKWALFTQTLGEDQCLFPYVPSEAVVRLANPPLYGVDIKRKNTGDSGGAWKTIPAVSDDADMNKLALPVWEYDEAATLEQRAKLEEAIGDIIAIRPTCHFMVNTIYDEIAEALMGGHELLLNIALEPGRIHRLMGFLRDHALRTLDQIEAMGILTENNDGQKYNSYSIRQDGATPVSARDLWLWSNSQVFGSVGPEQFNEFLLEYQKPVFARYGAISYGCCEDLTRKIDSITTVPNLRNFVASAWTDLEVVAPKCAERDLCIEWRQLASDMMGSPDFDRLEKHLRHGLAVTRGVRRFIVLQEVETIEGNIEKFRRWCRLAVELSKEMP